jgi:hypothetical protein
MTFSVARLWNIERVRMIDELKGFGRTWSWPDKGIVLAFTWRERGKQRRNPS